MGLAIAEMVVHVNAVHCFGGQQQYAYGCYVFHTAACD